MTGAQVNEETLDRSSFGAHSTADDVLQGIDLTGRRVLITGASGGLGAETARAMAAAGAEVIITARDFDKAQAVVAHVRAATGAELTVETLELGSFASIRSFARRFGTRHGRLDILINNAGVMACPRWKTEDGIELQFGCNHLGHFLLTNLLAPALAHGGRVVSLSSMAHHIAAVDFDDLQFDTRPYDKWVAYGQSKTANVLFSVSLNARLKDRGVEAFSVHPGMIETDLSRHQTDEDLARRRAAAQGGKLKFKSVAAGAATSVYAATAPELRGLGGAYLADCAISPVSAQDSGFNVVRPYAVDPAQAERLWSVSEAMVKARV